MSKPKFDDEMYCDYQKDARSKKNRVLREKGIRQSKRDRQMYRDTLIREHQEL